MKGGDLLEHVLARRAVHVEHLLRVVRRQQAAVLADVKSRVQLVARDEPALDAAVQEELRMTRRSHSHRHRVLHVVLQHVLNGGGAQRRQTRLDLLGATA